MIELSKAKEQNMTEFDVKALKVVKETLVAVWKEHKYSEDVKAFLDRACGSLDRAIEVGMEKAEKKYIAVFYDYRNKQEIEIPFFSDKRAGSYANQWDAEHELHKVYSESNRSTLGIHFVEAYRAK